MRVKVENPRSVGGYDFGEWLGLMLDNGCDRCGSDIPAVIVRVDGYGLMLQTYHPSRVSIATPEEEEAIKP